MIIQYRALFMLPLFVLNWIFRFVVWTQWGNIARFGLCPKHAPFSAHATVNGELFARIGTGTLKLVPNVAQFLPTKGTDGVSAGRVKLVDESFLDVDMVFMCTGYEIGFPFLDSKSICGLHKSGPNQVNMYKFVWPLKHKNIAFLGLIQPYGDIVISSIASLNL